MALRLSGVAIAALLTTVSGTALAQETPAAPATESYDGDIIVTAQKSEQRAVDVPITISANSGARMRELGVQDLDELSNYVPGLNVQEQSANNPGIVIRGITSDSGSAQQGPRGRRRPCSAPHRRSVRSASSRRVRKRASRAS